MNINKCYSKNLNSSSWTFVLKLSLIFLHLSYANVFAETKLKPDLTSYQNQIQPLLERYCYNCHDDDVTKGDVRLDNIDPDILRGKDAYLWDEVLEQLNNGSMPPPKKKKIPTVEEYRTFSSYLNGEFLKASILKNKSRGDSSVRRITRKELRFILQDLIGFYPSYLDKLPEDSGLGKSGFSTNASYMPFGTPQLWTYLESIVKMVQDLKNGITNKNLLSYKGMDELLRDIENPERQKPKREYSNAEIKEMKRKGIEPKWPLFLSEGFEKSKTTLKTVEDSKSKHLLLAIPDPPTMGRFRLILKMKGDANISVYGGHTKEDYFERKFKFNNASVDKKIKDNEEDFKEYTLEGSLEDFVYNFDNGKYNDLIVKINFRGHAEVSQIDFVGPIFDHVKSSIFQEHELSNNLNLEQWLKGFALKAIRRPLTVNELSKYKKLYQEISKKKSFTDAIWLIVEDILMSPDFFHVGLPSKNTQGIDNYKLAEKIALFLWSSIPDKTLFDLAAKGKLSDPEIIKKQVERMLKDEKANRFVESFTMQWLNFEGELDNVAINNAYKVNENFKALMKLETIASVNEVIRNKSSALNLLKSDYVMVNKQLANFYGIKGAQGNEFNKVKLPPESDRGGLLTQASILTSKADGLNSHPIKRGVWLSEAILGIHPPPPPESVPDLDPEIPGFDQMTLSQKMAIHRNNNACSSCHDKIDPWGILFEEFDAVGRKRDKVLIRPAFTPVYVKGSNIKIPKEKRKEIPAVYGDVESSTTLFTGQQLSGIKELKDYLLKDKKDQFANNLTRKFLSYAIWRDIMFYDRPLVDRLTTQFIESNFQVETLIQSIILSSEFQKSTRLQ